MKLCDTCRYRNNVEQLKPCIIYRDNCEYYEKERGDMTREEAIAYGKRVIDLGLNDETQAFCEMAIKALKVIEDIKAEIIKLQTYKCFEDTEKLVALDEVLQIIEKYRGESKDADSD